MDILYIDLETYSEVNLKKCGSYKYAEDCEILLFAYAFNEGPVKVWDCADKWGNLVPDDLYGYLHRHTNIVFCAHNSQFDRVVLEKQMSIKHDKWVDTAVRARRHSLPAALGDLCKVYKLPADESKKKEGSDYIKLFSKPHTHKKNSVHRHTRETDPEKWVGFVDYCKLDVIAMQKLYKLLPAWNDTPMEDKIWRLDQKINDAGLAVDIDLSSKIIKVLEERKEANNIEAAKQTDNAISTLGQRDKLIEYIREKYNYFLPNTQKDTVTQAIAELNDGPLRKLLVLRAENSKTSAAKYNTLISAACKDKRLRGTLIYGGASRTLRWAGRLFQPQNLPRPTIKGKEVQEAIEVVNLGYTDLVYGSEILSIGASLLRSVIVAEKGNKLVVSDYSSIEGVILAWVAGEEWKIQAYKDYFAGEGHDLYTLTYANTFGVSSDEVSKTQRQLGKILELALGYGGGVGAFMIFAAGYGVNLESLIELVDIPQNLYDQAEHLYKIVGEDKYGISKEVFITCDGIKRMWREANAAITTLWSSVEYDLLLLAAAKPGHKQILVLPYVSLVFEKRGSWGVVKLPSGHYLSYPGLKIDEKGKLQYWGVDAVSKKWKLLSTYGGKAVENIIQAIARDVLCNGMLNVDKAGYLIALTVHDEVVTEVPDTDKHSEKELNKILCIKADWMAGLPLQAEGFESYRYKK